MKTLILIFSFLISISIVNGQDIVNSYDNHRETRSDNLIKNYIKFDFSDLLLPKYGFLGFIDKDYKRAKIFFNSISKDLKNKDSYNVKGLSIIDNNMCDFEGTIKIEQVKEYINSHVWFDELNKDSALKARGYLIGHYVLLENKGQKNTGTFQGVVKLYWYLDNFNRIHYDDLEGAADTYCNNQYLGTWKSYTTGLEIICNWGEYRIPNSGDLDIGTGEFAPNPKYYNNGWKDYENK